MSNNRSLYKQTVEIFHLNASRQVAVKIPKKIRFGLGSRRFMEAQYEEHSKTNVLLPIVPMTGSQLELAIWFHYYLHWPAPYLPYQSTNKKATDRNQWLSLLVGPPGLEPGTKGLWAASRNKTYLKLIGYAWYTAVWKQMWNNIKRRSVIRQFITCSCWHVWH